MTYIVKIIERLSVHTKQTDKNQPPAERLSLGIDDIFANFPECIRRGGIVREFEERIVLDASPGFSAAPKATRLWATRPIPEKKEEALKEWSDFGGPYIMIHEILGTRHNQVDFGVDGDDVRMRKMTHGSTSFQGDKNRAEQAWERAGEILADLVAVDSMKHELAHKGQIADPALVEELLAWASTAEPADLGF